MNIVDYLRGPAPQEMIDLMNKRRLSFKLTQYKYENKSLWTLLDKLNIRPRNTSYTYVAVYSWTDQRGRIHTNEK
jgi:hypothetical protein